MKLFSIILLISAVRADYFALPRFWTSTGFCPIGPHIENTLLSQDVATNLKIIASLPNRAVDKIRIHWLLDLLERSDGR